MNYQKDLEFIEEQIKFFKKKLYEQECMQETRYKDSRHREIEKKLKYCVDIKIELLSKMKEDCEHNG